MSGLRFEHSNIASPAAGGDMLAALPRADLRSDAPISTAFRDLGCRDLRSAAASVWALPYGRNTDPADPLCVLSERRGTCSTKHALLARLIEEEGVEGIDLCLGIYEMSEANTPGIGATLARHGLTSIPEAHCYLKSGDVRIDVTRLDAQGEEPIGPFLFEETIRPHQTGEYKRAFHRRVLAEMADSGRYGPRTLDELWAIREACIAALSE